MVDEQYDFWYPTMYKNKKINFLKLFNKKIVLNQSPGRVFLNKLKKNSQNAKGISLMHQIKYELVKKELGINKEKVFLRNITNVMHFTRFQNLLIPKKKDFSFYPGWFGR